MIEISGDQFGHDGPQHIDGAAPPPLRSEGAVFRDGGEITMPVGNVSKAMPPQDVMDAAMMLTEACSVWTPTPLPKPDADGLPAGPVMHNQSYVLHQDLCSLATDPVAFNKKAEDVFAMGMVSAVGLMVLAWVMIRIFSWAYRWVRGRKQRSSEVLKRRLLVEAAKHKTDQIMRRQAPGGA